MPKIDLNDIAFLQYTGGTTGVSKGAMLSHANMLSNLEQIDIWITQKNKAEKELIAGSEIVITALPLYHIFALTANLLCFMKLGAENILISDPRDGNQGNLPVLPALIPCSIRFYRHLVLRKLIFRL